MYQRRDDASAGLDASPTHLRNAGIATSIDAEIRARTDAFAAEVSQLVRLAALEAVHDALGGALGDAAPRTPNRPRKELTPQPAPYVITPQAPPASGASMLSLDSYERAAYQRAVAECGGDIEAAGKLLGVGKSTIYRCLRFLGVDTSAPGSPTIRVDGPVSLDAYEKAAYQSALEQAGGSAFRAAKLLGIGKSSMYRAMRKHGLG